MIDPMSASWLAGLLDGEGCIDSTKGNPRIRIKMADLDLIIRAAHLMNARYHADAPSHRQAAAGERIKPLYIAAVTGARAVSVLRDILPHLSARRTQRATEIIFAYDSRASAVKPIRSTLTAVAS